jgi:hypothetical protein
MAAIDEVPPSGADYLSTESPTARTIVGVAALPDNVAEVIAFMPVGLHAQGRERRRRRCDQGSCRTPWKPTGPNDDPATDPMPICDPRPKTIDPDTGVPWANDATPELLIERTA